MHEQDMNEPRDPWLDALTAELAREREPNDLLEERTVRALRDAGLLTRPRSHWRIPRAWIAGAAAASIALFASGLALGQWLGSRQAVAIVGQRSAADYAQAAVSIERAGQAYVAALTQLAEQGGGRNSAQALYARETALAVLHDAANQIVRLAPNDPVTAKILQGFDQAEDTDRARQQAREPSRRVLWF